MFSTYEKLIEGLLDRGFGSVDHWLSSEELDGLRKSLLMHYNQENFHLAGVGNKEALQTEKKIRTDHIYWLDHSTTNPFEQQFLHKINDFVAYLNRTCFAGIASCELHYAVYQKGSYYKKHIDRFRNDDRRKFSIVFYLSENWSEGDGGELLLYTADTVTKIEPIPGRMVFFDSELPHEVLTSHILRLSLTGWMKTR